MSLKGNNKKQGRSTTTKKKYVAQTNAVHWGAAHIHQQRLTAHAGPKKTKTMEKKTVTATTYMNMTRGVKMMPLNLNARYVCS